MGYSQGEHWAILWIGSALLLLISFFSYASLQLLGCTPAKSLIAIGAFVFGSGLFHYGTYDASFSHIYSAFGISMMLWLVIRCKKMGWSLGSFMLLGCLTFWLYLVRQTNGALTFAIMIFMLSERNRKNKLLPLFIWITATIGAILIQLAYNYYVTSEIHLSSYGQEKFIPIGKHFNDVLLSYERGLITYYPVYLLTILLAIWTWRKALTWIFLICIITFALIYGSWYSWFLGGGMGHRGFVELSPLGLLVLGMSLHPLHGKKLLFVLSILIICVYITLSVMLGYWRGTFPFAGANESIYWSHLFHMKH